MEGGKENSSEIDLLDEEEEEELEKALEMEFDFSPMLEEVKLNDPEITDGIQLLWAPEPFNTKSGKMRRAYDIPLVNTWFKERCPKDYPIKVRVSYQKLLKVWILNSLHKRKPKPINKRSLFKNLAATA